MLRDDKEKENRKEQEQPAKVSAGKKWEQMLASGQLDSAVARNDQHAGEKEYRNKIRARGPVAFAESNVSNNNSSTSKQVANELKGVSVKAKYNSLFKPTQKSANDQERQVAEDLERLKLAEGNVRSKTEMLEAFFKQSSRVFEVVEHNEISRKAGEKLAAQKEKYDTFIELRQGYTNEIQKQVQDDLREYAENPVLQKKADFTKFLQLSFARNSYSVCLKYEYRRHLALNITAQLKKLREEAGAKVEITSNDLVGLLCDVPNQMAIQSINYYQDFFANEEQINDNWKGAGTAVRIAEMKVLYAAITTLRPEILVFLLCDQSNRDYAECSQSFNKAWLEWINSDSRLSAYIETGNGLATENHPWKVYHRGRMSEPVNASIDFTQFVPDTLQARAYGEIQAKINEDIHLRTPGLRSNN